MKTCKEAENTQTRQTILLFVVLAVISLFLGSLPALSFGQAAPGFDFPPKPAASIDSPQPPPAPPSFDAPASIVAAPADAAPAPTPPASPSPASTALPAHFAPQSSPPPTAPRVTEAVADQPPTLPMSAKADTVGNQEPTAKQLQERPDLLRSVGGPDHPFYNYFTAPNDPKSPIQGKPYSAAQLLDGVRHPSARRQLLVAYWELAGLLVESNIRLDTEQRVLAWYNETKKAGFTGAFYIAQQRRKATEIAFAQKQYQLVELLRSVQGTKTIGLTPENYPIPNDYPIAKNYVTYVDTIARSERARYVGRMIPYQAELIEARKKGRLAADDFFATTTRNLQAGIPDLVFALNQRTDAYVDLVATVIDYNKTIAEYTAETVGSNVSNYRLLSAVLELPKTGAASPTGTQPQQLATPPQRTLSQLGDQLPPPPTFVPGESAYSRPLADPAAPPSNPFAEVRSQPFPPSRPFVPIIAETAPPSPEVPPISPAEAASPADAPNPVQPASYLEEK